MFARNDLMKKLTQNLCLLLLSMFVYNVYGQDNNSLLFSQETNIQMGTASSVSEIDGEGYYSGEDIMLDVESTISSIVFPGYQYENNLEDTYTGAVLYIYEDNEGIPNGIPGKSGTPYYSLDLDKTDPLLIMTHEEDFNYTFTVETPDLTFEENKTYWIVFAIKIDFSEKLDHFEMWNWYTSTTFNFNDAVNIDPDDHFGSGMTYWLSIYDMTGGTLGDEVKGLSFFLYGEEETMGIEQTIFENQIQLFPNPTTYKLNINTPQNLTIHQINVYDLIGRLVMIQKDKTTMNVSNLDSGTYLVEINYTDGSKSTKKFIKL